MSSLYSFFQIINILRVMTSERVEPAGGRVTIGAVNTLLTLTSKELESLNLNKIIRLRLNSRISREFDPRLLNYERVPSVNIHIISNNFRHSSWVCEWSKCNNCQLVILTCSWQVWILKTHINQTLTNIPGLRLAAHPAQGLQGYTHISRVFLKNIITQKFTKILH